MVLQKTIAGEEATISLKPSALSVMFGAREVLAYDRAGRLYSWFSPERSLRRGLNGGALEKCGRPDGSVARRIVDSAEADAIAGAAAARIAPVAAAFAATEGDLAAVLARAAAFDAAAARQDRERFAQLYHPVGILPPDQYLALVLQATEGCSFNTCTFCELYRGARFRIKPAHEFREHARGVRSFLGESLSMRQSIFLGEANAMAAPTERLMEFLRIAREEIGPLPAHAFLDAFTGQRKHADEYRELAALGLRRVSIGMESGHDPLLAFVQKPSRAQDVAAAVAELKRGDVAVSVIVLLGLGGDRFAAGHAADTGRLLRELPLGEGDIVYFSELSAHAGGAYAIGAAAAGIRALTPAELHIQREAIVAGLPRHAGGPKVARYDIREFVY